MTEDEPKPDQPLVPVPYQNAFHWIGKYINDVPRLEEFIFTIFHLVLKINIRQAAIIFFRTPSVSSRITLVDELVREFIGRYHEAATEATTNKAEVKAEEDLKTWRSIKNEIEDALAIRNFLAHQPLRFKHSDTFIIDSDEDDDGEYILEDPADRIYAELYVSDNELARGGRSRNKIVKIDDLPIFYDKINEIVLKLIDFIDYLRLMQLE